jgi:hypothetical protein
VLNKSCETQQLCLVFNTKGKKFSLLLLSKLLVVDLREKDSLYQFEEVPFIRGFLSVFNHQS